MSIGNTTAAAVLCFAVISAHAGPFEDCVLSGMKGVSSDAAARVVNQACRTKINEAMKSKMESFGSPMRESEYEFVNSFDQEGDYFSQIFKNKSPFKNITYVAIQIRDADYHKYVKSSIYDYEGELAWQKERSITYYYSIVLKPNSQIKLMYRKPSTGEDFWSVVTAVLGREAKWSDSLSFSSGGGSAKPESKNPLE